ncbi:MAG: SDR family oxidoreductase, partial [Dehalococcoidia bacterium]|nr:SDR family oxidoreductase [Dehalococcoidia bacterium]
MPFLQGKSAIVTGAAAGLGRAFAEALAAEGADLTICDVQPAIADVGMALGGPGRKVAFLKADASQPEDVLRVVAAAREQSGGVDILVNNAGVWGQTPVTDAWEKALADYDRIVNTNTRGAFLFARACVPSMIARGGGEIVNVSTYYVLPARSAGTNPPLTDLYNASKWALNGFTDAWSKALKQHRIRVNALCMGATDTPMLRGLFGGNPPDEAVQTWMRPAQIAGQLLDLLREGPEGRT